MPQQGPAAVGALGRAGCSAELCSAADLCQTGAVTSVLPGFGCAGGVRGAEQAQRPAGTSDLPRCTRGEGRAPKAGRRFVDGVVRGRGARPVTWCHQRCVPEPGFLLLFLRVIWAPWSMKQLASALCLLQNPGDRHRSRLLPSWVHRASSMETGWHQHTCCSKSS